jgi:predicted nucleic acid-binding protein
VLSIPVVKQLNGLIRPCRIVVCGQIRQEVLQGSKDEKAFPSLDKQMELWESEAEQAEDFVEAARVFARLRWKGIIVPPTDCLIAAVALRRRLPLFTFDSDFDHIPKLERYYPTA